MKIVKLDDLKKISKNDIIVYPTDTIYGIGCYALNFELVNKLRKLKHKDNKPFSVIVDKAWIKKNCIINDLVKDYINKLPGKYTFILELNNKDAIASNVNNNSYFIGVRIPDHSIIKYLPIPFITTSVNISGTPYISNIANLPEEIKDNVDLIVDVGYLDNKPSTVIDLTSKKAIILRK